MTLCDCPLMCILLVFGVFCLVLSYYLLRLGYRAGLVYLVEDETALETWCVSEADKLFYFLQRFLPFLLTRYFLSFSCYKEIIRTHA